MSVTQGLCDITVASGTPGTIHRTPGKSRKTNAKRADEDAFCWRHSCSFFECVAAHDLQALSVLARRSRVVAVYGAVCARPRAPDPRHRTWLAAWARAHRGNRRYQPGACAVARRNRTPEAGVECRTFRTCRAGTADRAVAHEHHPFDPTARRAPHRTSAIAPRQWPCVPTPGTS